MQSSIGIMNQQFQLLADWNQEHINQTGCEEQIRKNIETMVLMVKEGVISSSF